MLKFNSPGSSKRPMDLSYGVVVLSVFAAVIILLLMEAQLQAAAHVSLFLFAIIISAWFGGAKPGLLAIALSILAFDYFFLPPIHSLAVETTQVPRLLLFVVLASFVAWVTATEKSEAESLKRARDDLLRINESLRVENIERKEAEEALKESETKYRQLFQSSHDIILFADRAGNILDINPRAEELTGYPLSDLRKMNIFQDLIVQEDQPVIREVIKDLFEGRSQTYKERWKTREGKIICLDGLSVPRISQNGEILSTFCTLRDITERKRAEDELRVSEAKFRALSENAPAAIFIYQGDKICYANPAVEVITGYSRQELLEMNFWETAHADFRDLLRERGLARQRGEPVPLRYEFKIVTKAGKERWIDFTDGKFQLDGKLAVIGMALDITERKRAEEMVRESHQLLQLVLATLPVGVAVTDRAGDIVLVNEASRRIWGGMINTGRERWAKSKGFWHDSGKRIAPTNWASVRALSEGRPV